MSQCPARLPPPLQQRLRACTASPLMERPADRAAVRARRRSRCPHSLYSGLLFSVGRDQNVFPRDREANKGATNKEKQMGDKKGQEIIKEMEKKRCSLSTGCRATAPFKSSSSRPVQILCRAEVILLNSQLLISRLTLWKPQTYLTG